jgi:hypothetical protein
MFDRWKKRNKLITVCPVCSGALMVTHLKCRSCSLELQGEFEANEFARLPQDKLDFLRTFVGCRGNLREVEAMLGISYPTIRARLDALLESLNVSAGGVPKSGPQDRASVLEALERGEIGVAEAERLLREVRE